MYFFNLHDDIGTDIYHKRKHFPNRLDDYHYPKLKQGKIKKSAIVCYFEGKETWKDMQAVILFVEATILKSSYFSFQQEKEIQVFIAVEGMCGIKENVKDKILWLSQHHVKIASLCWNDENALACGAKVGNQHLTPLGIECLQAMNEVHMIIDTSHCCELNFHDITLYATQPILASHSNPKGFFNHYRNLTDAQMIAIKQTGGIIGLLPIKWFITSNDHSIDTFVDVIDYAIKIVGIRNLAFGFDFMDYSETVDCMIKGLEDITKIPNLVTALETRGYSHEDIKRICFDNAEQFMKKNFN